MPVAVVTDSTHYLTRDLIADYEIHQVSLYVNDGGTLTREGEMPDFHSFYEDLRTRSDLPTTSQPSPGDFIAVYEPLIEQGYDIVSVHLGAGISGTCDSARQAAAELTGDGSQRRIEVVDSASAAGGLALIVLAAASAARGGRDVEAVKARTLAGVDDVKIWFSVDTLEYLRRGGRIGAAQAWLGSALKIKPILSFDEVITPVERVRTNRRAFERMVELLEERKEAGASAWVVQYIEVPELAEQMVQRGREIFGTDPIFCTEIGPVIGTHAGPGVLGVSGINPELIEP